tara:strand:- start:1351 stop:1590 length:240 start_codon:yes stop_codon:yes gene_type:complete
MVRVFLESSILWKCIKYIRLIGPKDKDTGYRPYIRLSYDNKEGWYYREDGLCGSTDYEVVIAMMKGFVTDVGLRRVIFH